MESSIETKKKLESFLHVELGTVQYDYIYETRPSN